MFDDFSVVVKLFQVVREIENQALNSNQLKKLNVYINHIHSILYSHLSIFVSFDEQLYQDISLLLY